MSRSRIRQSSHLSGLLTWLLLLLVLFFGVLATADGAENGSVEIKVDQVGYLTNAAKVAVVTAAAKTIEVNRASDNVTVFKGALGAASKDADTGDSVQSADFTKLQEAGTYYLNVPGVGRSWTFSIGRDTYLHTYYLATRAFYGGRVWCAMKRPFRPLPAGWITRARRRRT